MNRTASAALAAALIALPLSACGTSHAERRAMLDAEWAITNARADDIHAEYQRRMKEAETAEEREAVTQWRLDAMSKNMDDHYRRTAELSETWRSE